MIGQPRDFALLHSFLGRHSSRWREIGLTLFQEIPSRFVAGRTSRSDPSGFWIYAQVSISFDRPPARRDG